MQLAHAFLIHKHFLKPSKSQFHVDARLAEEWDVALQESMSSAIRRLKRQNLIVPAYTQPFSREAFHENEFLMMIGLIGKDEFRLREGRTQRIDRLLNEAPELMTSVFRDLDICVASDTGKLFAQTFATRFRLAQQQALEAFRQPDIPRMMQARDSLRADIGFPFGLPLPQPRPAPWFEILTTVSPTLLAPLGPYIEELRHELALESLLHKLDTAEVSREWTPTEAGLLHIQRPYAKAMLDSAATNLFKLQSFRRINATHVWVLVGHTMMFGAKYDPACEACTSLAKAPWPIDEAPELPHPTCTNALGCRCEFRPAKMPATLTEMPVDSEFIN